MYAELSDAALGAILGVTGIIPFVHVNTVIELAKEIQFADFGLFAVSLVFGRIAFELMASAKLSLAGEQTAFSLDKLKTSDLKIIFIQVAGAMAVSLVLFPFYSLVGKSVSKAIAPFIPFVLLCLFAWFTVSQKEKTNALLIACLAGITGVIVLEKNIPNSLFILLTGLYAVPLLFAKEEKIEDVELIVEPKLIVIGSLIGMTSAFLPATTPAMLTVTALSFIGNVKKFALLNASVIGSRAVSDFAALEFLAKGRSGATATMLEQKTYGFSEVYSYLFIGICLALLAMSVVLKVHRYLPTVKSFKTKALLAVAIFSYTFFAAGIVGVVALGVCTLVGLTSAEFNVARSNLGSCILFPAILNYL